MNPIWHKNCFGHLIETSWKYDKSPGQRFKQSAEKATKTEFYIFWALFQESTSGSKLAFSRLKFL